MPGQWIVQHIPVVPNLSCMGPGFNSPSICYQCIYMLIPPFILHFGVCPAPGTDGLTPAMGRTWCYFRGQRSFKEEGMLVVVGAIRTVDTGLDGSVVELLTRVAGVPDTIPSPADLFIVFILNGE